MSAVVDPPVLPPHATLIDRCASALAWNRGDRWHRMCEEERNAYRGGVRAVIAEMREPTEAMRKQFLHDAPTRVYQFMIDAALKD
jgi:hypothetical protein